MAEKQWIVGGYAFYTEKDALIAESELKKIEYIESRIDYSKTESVLIVLEKAINERIFKTPIGLQYLKSLQDFLLEQPEINTERVPMIQLYQTFSGEVRSTTKPAKNRIKVSQQAKDTAKSRLFISVALNVMLILAIIAMFSITLQSENPNILNYEKAITNRYAYWQQELTEREQIIREKERELNISQE